MVIDPFTGPGTIFVNPQWSAVLSRVGPPFGVVSRCLLRRVVQDVVYDYAVDYSTEAYWSLVNSGCAACCMLPVGKEHLFQSRPNQPDLIGSEWSTRLTESPAITQQYSSVHVT